MTAARTAAIAASWHLADRLHAERHALPHKHTSGEVDAAKAAAPYVHAYINAAAARFIGGRGGGEGRALLEGSGSEGPMSVPAVADIAGL